MCDFYITTTWVDSDGVVVSDSRASCVGIKRVIGTDGDILRKQNVVDKQQEKECCRENNDFLAHPLFKVKQAFSRVRISRFSKPGNSVLGYHFTLKRG